ncbi:MAG: hypothetical protein ATN35_13220 [Epulopiscium sp. Nele67-Bin004]|nr:MAG: hypothetical protein ATN35_13220 [Epulopiscium sp. Nele67-Bin004]
MIRFIEKKDIEAVYNIYKYYILNTSITFEITVPTLDDFIQRVNNIAKTHPYIVYEVDNNIVGYAYASRYGVREAFNWSVESTVYLDNNCKGNGIGSRLYTILLKLLEIQGFHTTYALITSSNQKSAVFHQQLGFEHITTMKKIGYKFDEWHDINYYSLILNQHTNPPKNILNIEQLKKIIYFDGDCIKYKN